MLVIAQLEDELKLFKRKNKLQINDKQCDIDSNGFSSNNNSKTTISNLSTEKNIESLSKVQNDIIGNTTVTNHFTKLKTNEDKNLSIKTPISMKFPSATISMNNFDFDDQHAIEFPTFDDDHDNNKTNGSINYDTNINTNYNNEDTNKTYSSDHTTPNGDEDEKTNEENKTKKSN